MDPEYLIGIGIIAALGWAAKAVLGQQKENTKAIAEIKAELMKMDYEKSDKTEFRS